MNDGILGYNLFAYCWNNPVNYVDPEGKALIPFFVALLVIAAFPLVLSGCNNASSNTENIVYNDNSWADDDPILSVGRYKNYNDAVKQASHIIKEYANNHDKEVGLFIYELYGGYYISRPQSGILATKESIKIDLSYAPYGSAVVATFHSHPWHNDNIIYNDFEYKNVVDSGIPSYVTDVCGCTYVLKPNARNYMDYKTICLQK